MANPIRNQNTGLEAVVGSEQTVPRTEQFYDQVIATQRQVAGKDYQSIVSGLSKYDFQGTLEGTKTYVKKELNHLSFDDLAELSVSLKEQYQTQKNTSGVDKSARREYRSAIATVNYYRNQKKKEKESQKMAMMERQENWSYKREEDEYLAADFIKDEVYAAGFVRKKSSFDDAMDVLRKKNGVKVEPRKKIVPLDVFDVSVNEKAAPEYSGLSYHLRESRSYLRGTDEYLAADFTGPVTVANPVNSGAIELDIFDLLVDLDSNDQMELLPISEPEYEDIEMDVVCKNSSAGQSSDAGLSILRQAVYDEKLQRALLPRWDTDSFFQ